MNKRAPVIPAVAVCLAFVGAILASESGPGVSVRSMPPVVVKTVPMSGDTSVDASKVKEVRVTFSKDMADKSWSWVTLSKDTQLPTHGQPRYRSDGRTCAISVDLEPGETYAVWLNTQEYTNFKDTGGRPAVPYLLVFETKAAD